MLLTREEQKLGKLLSPFRQVFGIKLGEFDLKVCRSNGLGSPTWNMTGGLFHLKGVRGTLWPVGPVLPGRSLSSQPLWCHLHCTQAQSSHQDGKG